MDDLSITRIGVSKDAAMYTLFLVEKVSQAPDATYHALLDALYQQWQPSLFQGQLPEAVVMISSLDRTAWRKASIEEPADIEALVQGGDALRQHARYGLILGHNFLQGARIVIAPGLLDEWYDSIATVLREATQKPLAAESRKTLEDCAGRIQRKITSLRAAETLYA